MKKIYRNRKFIATLLLFSIAVVSFPIQEFFHEHHAFEDECTTAQSHKCEHSQHISEQDFHTNCVFLLQNSSFLQIDYTWNFFPSDFELFFNPIEREYVFSFYYFYTRGPPSAMIA